MNNEAIAGYTLHLGILQNRLAEIGGEINVCKNKVNMCDDGIKRDKIFDKEEEELKLKALEKRKEQMKQRIDEYEDKVLELTAIK